jgi:hypothetical protein
MHVSWPGLCTYSLLHVISFSSSAGIHKQDFITYSARLFPSDTVDEQKKNSVATVLERLYRLGDRRLSAKLVPTFADRSCHVVIVTDPYGGTLGFLDRSRYFFFQVAPQLYTRGWVDPVPDPILLRKYGSDGNRTQTNIGYVCLAICEIREFL